MRVPKLFLLFAVICCAHFSVAQKKTSYADSIPVAQVWLVPSVDFDILTSGKYQYACYYDMGRNMMIAARPRNSKTLKKTTLPPVVLPVKWRCNSIFADPAGPWNGLINIGYQLTLDNNNVPYISYHKFDKNSISQVFIMRYEKRQYGRYTRSANGRTLPGILRGGSLAQEAAINSLSFRNDHTVAVSYGHLKYGSEVWILDDRTMAVKEDNPNKLEAPKAQAAAVINDGMVQSSKADNTSKYVMKCSTLHSNQDLPRPKPYPAPTELVAYRLPDKM